MENHVEVFYAGGDVRTIFDALISFFLQSNSGSEPHVKVSGQGQRRSQEKTSDNAVGFNASDIGGNAAVQGGAVTGFAALSGLVRPSAASVRPDHDVTHAPANSAGMSGPNGSDLMSSPEVGALQPNALVVQSPPRVSQAAARDSLQALDSVPVAHSPGLKKISAGIAADDTSKPPAGPAQFSSALELAHDEKIGRASCRERV